MSSSSPDLLQAYDDGVGHPLGPGHSVHRLLGSHDGAGLPGGSDQSLEVEATQNVISHQTRHKSMMNASRFVCVYLLFTSRTQRVPLTPMTHE